MDKITSDFIREDESHEDEGIIGCCDGCNDPIHEGDQVLSAVVHQGNGSDIPVLICEKCQREMSHRDLLDLLGIPWFDSENSVAYARSLARYHAET